MQSGIYMYHNQCKLSAFGATKRIVTLQNNNSYCLNNNNNNNNSNSKHTLTSQVTSIANRLKSFTENRSSNELPDQSQQSKNNHR
eukprot:5116028-Amphidinium_carterae.1